MAFPDRVQPGYIVKFLDDWNDASNLRGVRRKISLFYSQSEPRRSIETQCKRDVLRQRAGGICLSMVAIKLAQNLSFFFRLIVRFGRLGDFSSNLRAQR